MNTLMTMKMKFKKNQKGLTLIELLAVIVILGVIAAIAVPSIGGIIADSKVKADIQTETLIESAAVMWALQQVTPPVNGATVTVTTLVNAGYLSAAPINQATGFTYVTITLTLTGGNYTAVVTVPTA